MNSNIKNCWSCNIELELEESGLEEHGLCKSCQNTADIEELEADKFNYDAYGE